MSPTPWLVHRHDLAGVENVLRVERLLQRAQGKQKYLKAELGPEAIDAMRALKQALDPQNIFNPGKIVPVN